MLWTLLGQLGEGEPTPPSTVPYTTPTLGLKRSAEKLCAIVALILDAGPKAEKRFTEFFTANIRNRNTRLAYGHAIQLFLDWCENHGRALEQIDPIFVSVYIELLLADGRSKPTVKQHLAATTYKSNR